MDANRIVVVGAGIIGASIAYHLVKRGAKVVIVDAVRPGAGATEKSFGWINATFSKRPQAYFDLNQVGLAGWRRLETELGGELKVQWGGSVAWSTRRLPTKPRRICVKTCAGTRSGATRPI